MKYPTDYKYNVLVEIRKDALITNQSIGQCDNALDIIALIKKSSIGRVNAYGYKTYTIVNQQDNSIRVITKQA